MCGGVVGDVLGAAGDVVSGVGDVVSGAIDTVTEHPLEAALLAAGVYYAPELGAFLDSTGATVGATAEEAAATTGIDTGALQASTALDGSLPAGYTGYTAPAVTDIGTVAGSTEGIAGGAATTGATDAATKGIFDGITLGNVGSALAIAGGINSLTGGGVTKALGLGGDTKVVTGGGTGGSGGSGGGGTGGGAGGGTTDISTAAGALKVADPFSAYRSQMADMYAGYLTGGNKTDITQMPGYSQFQTGVLDPAMEATKRSAAKSGQMISGNELIALQKQGQTGYSAFMNDYLNRLATASGATTSPATAAQLASGTATAQQQATMQGLGGVLTGAAGLIGGSNLSNLFGGSSNTYTGSPDGMQMAQNSVVPNQSNLQSAYDAVGTDFAE